MGRQSVLSPEQWADIDRRVIEGEAVRALAVEHGISETAIRKRFKRIGKGPTVQKVAQMMVETQAAFEQLPAPAQIAARGLAERLRSISEAVATVADTSARSAIRLSALANTEVGKIDDAEPLSSEKNLKAHIVLQKAANEALAPALNLLSANRDAAKRFVEDEPIADETITPERIAEGARRIAFALHRAASMEG